jgi:hypothetical protein
MPVGWNKVNGIFVSREKAIAAGIVPPPKRRRVKAAAAPPAAAAAPPAEPPAELGTPPAAVPEASGKVLHFSRPTLDEALNALRSTAPPPEAIAAAPMQPPPEAIAAAPMQPPPPPGDDPESFAALGGKLTASAAVAMCGAILRRRGYEPRDPDEDDTERLERGAARAIRKSIGDRPIPLWMELSCGVALLYMSMGNGARKLEPSGPGPAELDTAADAPVTAPPAVPRTFGASTSRGGRIVADRPPPVDVGPSRVA